MEESQLPPEDRAAPRDEVVVTDDGEVITSVVVGDGGASGRGRLTVLRLSWHAADPLAVQLALEAQPDHPALPRGSWSVLRDFLRYGLEEPTGDGEVRLAPDPARDVVVLQLRNAGRPTPVSLPRPLVRAFLQRTAQDVPFGEERGEPAVEALLRRLLDSAG